jgi:hypothetical protein
MRRRRRAIVGLSLAAITTFWAVLAPAAAAPEVQPQCDDQTALDQAKGITPAAILTKDSRLDSQRPLRWRSPEAACQPAATSGPAGITAYGPACDHLTVPCAGDGMSLLTLHCLLTI